jgi:mono/diheme cytochrome c family protein
MNIRMFASGSLLLLLLPALFHARAQSNAPSQHPFLRPYATPKRTVVRATPAPATPTLPPPIVVPPPAPAAVPSALRFDAPEKTAHLKAGEMEASFTFAVTNQSNAEVVISSVHTSCGCTAARLPATPWVLKPGEGGEIGATMNLAGKYGTITKTVTVVSSAGSFPLYVKAVLPNDAFEQLQRAGERSRNMQVAAADRQAVFRGDCARCHVEPTVGKVGRELYTTACGICHDSPHRATMVPALRGRPGTFTPDYWTQWIRNGKEGSLMPAFTPEKKGPLTEQQIQSLATYLSSDFTREPVPATNPATPSATTPPPAL